MAINEQTFNADPLPVYPFKFMIPFAGALVLMQGIAEIIRCIVCLKTGAWTPRLKDAQESDVVAQQLEGSEFVDDDAKRLAIDLAWLNPKFQAACKTHLQLTVVCKKRQLRKAACKNRPQKAACKHHLAPVTSKSRLQPSPALRLPARTNR